MFVNRLMRDGKKSTARGVFYDSFDLVEQRAKRPPLEVFEEAFAFGIVEHAFDLGVADPGVGEFAGSGEVKELLVGHGGPQEIGELGGEGVVVGFFLAVQEEEPG